MATNKSYGGDRRATAPSQAPAIPEPTFRSALWIGAVALAAVVSILIYALASGHRWSPVLFGKYA